MNRERERARRFDDGEVVRYGAGESWRPTPRDRSPRRARSPARSRDDRGPPRSPRPRSPLPRARSPGMSGGGGGSVGGSGGGVGGGSGPGGSDSYVPGRYVPRRRSRSIGFRRDRSRDRGGDSPRRRHRTRSPLPQRPRRSPPLTTRRSPLALRSPTRRGSPIRDVRFDRDRPPRSPRRDWGRDRLRDMDRDRDRMRDRDRDLDRRDDRRRSRSPLARPGMDRTSGKTTPSGYRPRSRSPGRRDDRYQSYRRPSPPRDSGVSSALPSQSASERTSPIPRTRSPYRSRDQSPRYGAGPPTGRDGVTSLRSPPRGPAALRIMPSDLGRAGSGQLDSPSSRSGGVPDSTASPANPPSGPRGYVPAGRSSTFALRGRGGWSQSSSTRATGGPPSGPLASSMASISSGSIPTGPRSSQSISGGLGGVSASNSAANPTTQGRPFNPPTGPAAAQHGGGGGSGGIGLGGVGVGGVVGGGGPRQSLAQGLLSTMPPLVPGGKLDPSMLPMMLGVSREVEPRYRKLRDEEEKLREELRGKQERLRKSLSVWSRQERDAAAWELRSNLSEKSMKNLAGEGVGGAAF